MTEPTGTEHATLEEQVLLAARLGALRAVMFNQAVAQRIGLHATDINCLNALTMTGEMTAGELAAHVGLTRGGAITAAIDRLERAGFLVRERDTADRRRVLLKPTGKVVTELLPLFGDYTHGIREHLAGRSDGELRTIRDYLATDAELAYRATLAHQDGTPARRRRHRDG